MIYAVTQIQMHYVEPYSRPGSKQKIGTRANKLGPMCVIPLTQSVCTRPIQKAAPQKSAIYVEDPFNTKCIIINTNTSGVNARVGSTSELIDSNAFNVPKCFGECRRWAVHRPGIGNVDEVPPTPKQPRECSTSCVRQPHFVKMRERHYEKLRCFSTGKAGPLMPCIDLVLSGLTCEMHVLAMHR